MGWYILLAAFLGGCVGTLIGVGVGVVIQWAYRRITRDPNN